MVDPERGEDGKDSDPLEEEEEAEALDDVSGAFEAEDGEAAVELDPPNEEEEVAAAVDDPFSGESDDDDVLDSDDIVVVGANVDCFSVGCIDAIEERRSDKLVGCRLEALGDVSGSLVSAASDEATLVADDDADSVGDDAVELS